MQIAHSQLGYPHRPGAHGTTQLGSHAWRLGSRHRSRSRQLLHAAQMTSGSTHVAHGSCTESKNRMSLLSALPHPCCVVAEAAGMHDCAHACFTDGLHQGLST